MGNMTDGYEVFCEAIEKAETPVLFCEQFDEKSDIWNFSSHKHDCIELLYFLYGNAEVKAAGTSTEATFYDIVIYPKGMFHTEQLQFNHHQEVICVWVDIPGLELPNAICIQDKDASIKWLLENLHSEYKSEHPCHELIRHYVKTTAMLIARKCFEGDRANDVVSRVMKYIQDHMAETLTVTHLAEIVYVSKSYLSRIFKQKTGMTLIEYQRSVRINTAKMLLVSSNTSVEEITYIVGYNCPKYFSRAFHICTGKSPREFKNEEKSKMISVR